MEGQYKHRTCLTLQSTKIVKIPRVFLMHNIRTTCPLKPPNPVTYSKMEASPTSHTCIWGLASGRWSGEGQLCGGTHPMFWVPAWRQTPKVSDSILAWSLLPVASLGAIQFPNMQLLLVAKTGCDYGREGVWSGMVMKHPCWSTSSTGWRLQF
jgi:hypothetical protein